MGATRLGTSPATRVVDGDCRVHPIDNLFVAGSSVFPTYGWANPTLPIAALALRLTDHLAGQEACRRQGGYDSLPSAISSAASASSSAAASAAAACCAAVHGGTTPIERA